MGQGTLSSNFADTSSAEPMPPTTSNVKQKNNNTSAVAEGRKPLLVAGEGVSPQKPVAGMPTFGTMKPGISFKNVVTQHAPLASKEVKTTPIVSEVTAPGGGTSLKFGSLPLRVQSAPPELKEERSTALLTSTVNAASGFSNKVSLEVTPEEGSISFSQPHAKTTNKASPPQLQPVNITPAMAETAQPFVPSGEIRQFQPQQAYYGNVDMNYAAGHYVPMAAYYGAHHGNRHYGGNHQGGFYPPQAMYHHGGYHSQNFRPYVPYQTQAKPSEGVSETSPKLTTQSAVSSGATVIPPTPYTPTPAATAARQPTKKIQIVDPNTGKEVELSTVPKITKPVVSEQAEEHKVGSQSLVSPQTALPSRKPVVLINPISNEEIDLNRLVSSTTKSAQDAAQAGERIDILEGLDDDAIFSGSESAGESDEDSMDDFELPEGVQFPVILTRAIKVSYPENTIPFKYPPEEEPLRYTSEFLLQFQPHCKGDAQDFATVAFPKDLPEHGARRREERRGNRHSRNNAARQYSAEQLTLSNRAADAWKRAEAMALDEDLVLLREVKQILNKLTEDKFETLTKQILALEILKSAVMTGVIDMLFDKAVEEPRYAPLYARLCLNITRFEAEQLAKLLPSQERASAVKQSMFRGHLVAKCQIEYNEKRAYSKQRLERLKAKELAESGEQKPTEGAESKPETTSPTPAKPHYSGELTEEDYILIKTKRRVLGNMRFIGELYLAGLIGPKIMHSVIQELLADVENPEDEEVESVCRLIPTIGAHLDTAESAPLWAKYIERLRRLSNNPVLPTRVRFMVQDVLELRNNGWKKVIPAAPTNAPPSSSGPSARRGERSDRDRDTRRDRRESGDVRRYSSGTSSGAPSGGRFAPNSQDARFERSGSGQSPRIQVKPNRATSGESIRSTGTPVSRVSQESINRYHALDDDVQASTDEVTAPSPSANPSNVEPGLVDEKLLAKLAAVFDEALQQKNYPDVLALVEDIPGDLRGAALRALALHGMDKGRKHVNALISEVIPLLLGDNQVISPSTAVAGLGEAFELLDDLVVDIPSALEFAGMYSAALIDAGCLDLATLVDKVLGGVLERAPLTVAKVVLYTVKSSKLESGKKRSMLTSSSKVMSKCVFEPANRSSVEALAAKLEILDLVQIP